MSSSFSFTETSSFTVTHAKYIASKVATDLKRLQRFYGKPSDAEIAEYEAELTVLLRDSLVKSIWYGFKRDGQWIEPALRYTARDLHCTGNDDDPGRVRPGMNVDGATFYSFLTYSDGWTQLTDAGREEVRKKLPFHRGSASEPAVSGYLSQDLSYSAGCKSLARASVRSVQ